MSIRWSRYAMSRHRHPEPQRRRGTSRYSMITRTSLRTIDTIHSWLAKRCPVALFSTARSLGALRRPRADTPRRTAIIYAMAAASLASSAFAVEPMEEIVEQRFDVAAGLTLSIQNI